MKKKEVTKLAHKMQSRLEDKLVTKGKLSKGRKGVQERSKSQFEEEKYHWEYPFFQFCYEKCFRLPMMDECPVLHSKQGHMKSQK
jgi:hypothetical protein